MNLAMCIIYIVLFENQKNRTKHLFLLVNTEEIHLSLSTTNDYNPSVSLIFLGYHFGPLDDSKISGRHGAKRRMEQCLACPAPVC